MSRAALDVDLLVLGGGFSGSLLALVARRLGLSVALIEKAKLLGADAVINVTYSSGVGFTTWGYMDAKGKAVRFTK